MPRVVEAIDFDRKLFKKSLNLPKDPYEIPYEEGDLVDAEELQCLVSWNPQHDNPGYVPDDSFVKYSEIRNKCPIVLVEYFERKVRLVKKEPLEVEESSD